MTSIIIEKFEFSKTSSLDYSKDMLSITASTGIPDETLGKYTNVGR
ncbi:MAG: hypothetical protein P0116_06585 [Candidatus Nitrosocosmicus sp.]|nr:hypothetical protein [Candidatus Nitrosocosmicus sp.]